MSTMSINLQFPPTKSIIIYRLIFNRERNHISFHELSEGLYYRIAILKSLFRQLIRRNVHGCDFLFFTSRPRENGTVFLEFDINVNATTFERQAKSEKLSQLHLIRPTHFYGPITDRAYKNFIGAHFLRSSSVPLACRRHLARPALSPVIYTSGAPLFSPRKKFPY